MKIYFDDGLRICRNTGYGNLARSLLTSLIEIPGVHVFVGNIDLVDDGLDLESLLKSECVSVYQGEDVDFNFRVSPPEGRELPLNTIVYTQNALGGLIPDWQGFVRSAHAVIVPGEFDAGVFRRYNEKVFVCPQTVNNSQFSPIPRYRSEGVEDFTFIFAGSFSFRKGVDLLFPVLDAASRLLKTKVNLKLICPTGLEKSPGLNRLIRYSREMNPLLSLQCINDNLTPAWMQRHYNQSDAFITLSRGEGWCMPAHEALLCAKPVISPSSTALGECLPEAGVIRVPVNELACSDIVSDFGMSMKSKYGTEGVTYYESKIVDAVAAVCELITNYQSYESKAKVGRNWILENYNTSINSLRLAKILNSL